MNWNRELPVGWRQRRLRFDVRANPVKSELNLSGDTEVSFVPMEAVGEFGGLDLERVRPLEDVYNGYTYFSDGDVCIAKITPCFENGKGALAEGLFNGVAFGTTELHVLRANDTIDPQFLFYISIASNFREIGASEMLGAGGQKRVPESFLKDWTPPLPSLEIQKQIVEFLDNKTAQIDGLIARKQALLERLAEKRQAIITQAVTKGLNSNAAMKDSGIDWLGHIPAHWKVKRLKFVGKTILGLTYSPFDVVNEGEGLLVLRSSNVQSGKLAWGDNVFVQSNVPDELLVRTGDILICSRNGSRALIGKNAVITSQYAGQTFGAFMTVFRTEMHRFIHLVLNSELFAFQSGRFMTSTINQLTVNAIKDFAVPIPPEEEQQEIADVVDEKLVIIDKAVDKLSNSISHLREYRSALITAAISAQLEI